MRPLLDWLRWKLFDFLQRYFPSEQPSDNDYLAYLREQERAEQEAMPFHLPPIEPQEIVQLPTLEWSSLWFRTHPHAVRNTGPMRPVRLQRTDEIPTARVLQEDTIKARAIVKGYHEERHKEQSC